MKSRFLSRFIAGLGIALALGAAGAFGVLSSPEPVFAQDDGLATISEETGLGSEDPKLIIARLIRNGLSLIGIVAVCICLYGGFVWMTSAGNPEKVDKAKKILLNGGIGLAIILLSWTITSFVIGALSDATGSNGSSSGNGGGSGSLGSGGGSTSFVVTDYAPEGDVNIRNVVLRVTFSQSVEESTVAGAVTVTNAATGATVEGTTTVSGNRVTFIPTAACPEPNEDRFCFDADTTFTVAVADTIESTSGRSLQCTSETCASTFTTGSLIDTEDPVAVFVYPDDGDSIPTSSSTALQVTANDDSEVAGGEFAVGELVLGSVAAEGENLTDVLLETTWETDGLENGERYKVTTTVTDIAGNTDEDSVTVRARPATCFNGVIDGDMGETAVDCGGDSSSANYCGACDGSSCTEAAECSSGSCVAGVCSATPEILRVTPDDGAVGTYVTISGSGFGNSNGTVLFGTVEAEVLASCGEGGWSDDEIVVAVPAGAVDAAITVTSSEGDQDATDDDNGTLLADFDVNEVYHPGLCSLSPNTGDSGEVVAISGSGFGGTRGDSEVNFGSTEAGAYSSWSASSLAVTVPSASDDVYEVTVTVDGETSNALQFLVESVVAESATVTGVTPDEGGNGQYITISGTGFGSSIGTVTLRSDETGDETVASVDFPSACSDSYWSSGEIVVIIPDDIGTGTYDLFVTPRGGSNSNEIAFTVSDADPTPGICAIEPDGGDVGDDVVIYGDNFGSSGSVTFSSDVAATASAWDDEEITVSVPAGTATGPVVVTSGGEESNAVNFELGGSSDDGDSEGGASLAAAYAWSFSTGEIPDVPAVVTECSDTTVSAVPNSRFTDDGAVCVNAVVYAEFTTLMDEASVKAALTVERCDDDACDDVTAVAGEAVVMTGASMSTVTWVPTSDFAVSTKYHVTIASSAASTDGATMNEDVSWTFTTAADTDPCVVERVVVAPHEVTVAAVNDTAGFQGNPVTGCVITDASDYSWEWSLDTYSFADFNDEIDPDCSGDPTACATVEALAEGDVTVTAAISGGGVSGDALFSINFTDPYVSNVFPNCTEACTNAAIGASFNTGMDEASISSANILLYRCSNELCSSLERVESAVPACTYGDDSACTGFLFDDVTLAVSTFYRVVVSGDVMSASGVALTRANYGTDYSWTFRVREDATVCAVDRIALEPSSVAFTAIDESRAFTGAAFGAADSCSTSGQQLSASDFNWTWSPIEDSPDNSPSNTLAEWHGDGLIDSDVSTIVPGCSALCIAAGSQEYQAICGNGDLEQESGGAGEDCDDGNTENGDGCSATCQREGEFTGGTCGDGTLDRNGEGAGEDCDDGNVIDGDGCSSTCIAEGASSIEATCGNNDVAATAAGAGEECDDGNAQNGDGCSRECVREGSVTSASLGGAMCGDGEITSPYETCDDRNTVDGDGCSSSCVREGFKRGVSECGNDSTEREDGTSAGEDCDGQEGCTDECTYAGASAEYTVPSFCGDGTDGLGELAECENGAMGDGNIDATQVAFVTQGAVYEVSAETREARAVFEVTEESSGLSATADLTLSCTADVDTDCSDPDVYGVGLGGCCIERPTVTLNPAEGMENVCRNAAIYGEFTEQMDTSTFVYTTEEEDGDEITMYRMYARWDGEGRCPHSTLGSSSDSVAVRMWQRVRNFFLGEQATAAVGDCYVPIAGYNQVPVVVTNEDGTTTTTYKVSLRYTEALEPNSTYTLVIEGDGDATDEEVDGVRSRMGVALLGTEETSFTTNDEICAIDEVTVLDADEESPNVFTVGDESHAFVASAIARVNGTAQEIQSIDEVYAWSWTSWASGDTDVVSADQDSTYSEAAIVTAEGQNGETTVSAVATITADDVGGTTGERVTGTADVLAYLCENPWPELSKFPWTDDATGVSNGHASLGVGYMNFSMSYCRDAGSDADVDEDGANDGDLPAVSVVYAPLACDPTVTPNCATDVIKEYFFQVNDGSSDAIGVRIVSNSEYLSPMAWYRAQDFVGSPTETDVDGFAAIEDGRTTYVAAPNVSGSSIYPNIYVISYNEGASESTLSIYDQMLANLSFLTDQSDERICYVDGAATSTACESDFDCSTVGGTCSTDKLELQRDMQRLTDMTDVAASLEDYENENGVVPTLPSGTYVRSLAASTWSSWSEIFGGALGGDMPTDPLNRYVECGETSSIYSAYDAATCVEMTAGEYVCPDGSYAYHYRSVGETGYELSAELEFDGASWYGDIDSDTSDAFNITANLSGASFCNGSIYGSSATCGDGVVGGDEVCEIGQSGDPQVCTTSGGDSGYINRACNSTCDAWIDATDAECVPASCGNGVVEGDEMCDDGAQNGEYGYCGTSCTFASGSYCGDGEVSGSESCDCGDSTVTDSTILGNARAYGAGAGSCGDNRNGDYAANPNTTCAWDCTGAAATCGDGDIDSGEQCDGAPETWSGGLCTKSYGTLEFLTSSLATCTTDADCSDGEVCGDGSASNDDYYVDECPVTEVCIDGPAEVIGMPCYRTRYDCNSTATSDDGECSTIAYPTTRTRSCEDDGSSGQECTLAEASWFVADCKAAGSCGDGTVDEFEECDDGNSDNTDSCTNSCTVNICGDGHLLEGEEQCDEGTANGEGCSSAYGSSCTACSLTCRYEVASGAFCGDGEVNGDEYCDGTTVPYTYYDATLGETYGDCYPGDPDISGVRGSVPYTYVCTRLGVCDGGLSGSGSSVTSLNGESCTTDSQCGGGACVYPSCDGDCESACPFTEESTSLDLTTNQPGAAAHASVDLYTYSSDSTSQIPNAATITVPACSAATSLVADVSFDNVTPPDVYVVFVTDTSPSMGYDLGGNGDDVVDFGEVSRIDVAKQVLEDSVTELFDDLGETVQVGLVRIEGTPTMDSDFMGEDEEASLQATIDAYAWDTAWTGTNTGASLQMAKGMLDAIDDTSNVRKIVVVMSDGQVNIGSTSDPESEADDAAYSIILDGYELYSVALTTDSDLISDMNRRSSNSSVTQIGAVTSVVQNDSNPTNLIDYSYFGSTADEFEEAYETIIESITSATAVIYATFDGTTYETRGSLQDGVNLQLPWPTGFACDPNNEQEVPVQITFGGEGQIEVGNVRLEYCSP